MTRLPLCLCLLLSGLAACAHQSSWETVGPGNPALAGALPSTAQLAVLSVEPEGSAIRLLDSRGEELAFLWTGLDGADALAWDSASGQFLVRGDGELRVVNTHGTWWTVDRTPEDSTRGMSFTADGQRLLAQETTLSARSSSGADEQLHDASRCFWDTAARGEHGLSIDVMTGSVVRWTPGSSEVEDLFIYTDEEECWHEPGILGTDRGGAVWIGRIETGDITVYDGELEPVEPSDGLGLPSDAPGLPSTAPTARSVVRLAEVDPQAQAVLALASGGTEDIYALFTGPSGEGIVHVTRSGEAQKLVSAAGGALWVDLVAIP